MEIEPLSKNMHFFHDVAKLKFQEFSYLTGNETFENYLERQKKYITEESIPKSYVVLNESRELIGTFALKLTDLSTRLDLSPWLGGLVVAPSFRRQGVGSYIVNQAECLAKELGYSELYLYTPDKEAWYAKQGWQLMDRSLSGEFPISVMYKTLKAD